MGMFGRLGSAFGPVRKIKQGIHRFLYRSYATRRLAADGFDRDHGTDTSRLFDAYAPNGDRVYRYETVCAAAIHTALRSLNMDLSAYTFVELGCGMGRPLIIASGYPFRRLMGVDISSSCIVGAARNLAACGLTDRVELSVGDAGQFAFPCEPLVVYMFNPFPADVVARVVASLERRLRSSAERVAVIYIHPVHADLVEGSGLFEKVAHVPGRQARHEAAMVFLSRVVEPVAT